MMTKQPFDKLLLMGFALSLSVWLTACQSTNSQVAPELQSLQGNWESEEAASKSTITIKNNSLHFYERSDHWFKTHFELVTHTDPKQLHATIKDSSQPSDTVGKVVAAFFKMEDSTLNLAVYDHESDDPPSSFEDDQIISAYKFRKIQNK